MKLLLWRIVARVGHQLGMHWLLARFLAGMIDEIRPSEDGGPAAPSNDAVLTILALAPEEFRGDPELLAAEGSVKVLRLPEVWAYRLFYTYLPTSKVHRLITNLHLFVKPAEGSKINLGKRRYRKFLELLLPRLYRHLGVNCVISHHIFFHPDIDLGAVSDKLGYPYFVLHREGVSGGPESFEYRGFLEMLQPINGYGFEGSHMIVQNDLVRQLFVEAGVVRPDQASPLGTLRMDRFLKRNRFGAPSRRERRKLVLFPFMVGGHILKEDVNSVFRDVHKIIIEFARDHPEYDVVIKPKGPDRWFRAWLNQAQPVFEELGIDPEEIPGLTIRFDLDAQDLILESDVVCALNSTTMLEAGVAGKAVIVPYFGALRNPFYDDRIYLRHELHNFDVAETVEAFRSLILQRMAAPDVDPEILAGRRSLFAQYVSGLDEEATDRYISLMTRIVRLRTSSNTGAVIEAGALET